MEKLRRMTRWHSQAKWKNCVTSIMEVYYTNRILRKMLHTFLCMMKKYFIIKYICTYMFIIKEALMCKPQRIKFKIIT